MKTYGLNSAEYIKGKVIDFFLLQNQDILIGNEIMYGTERRLVDLVLLQNNKVTAIEIKSDNDNLKRIERQINEYRKIFNYVILVVTSKQLNKVLENSPDDVGVYLINDISSMERIRSPKLQKHLIKEELLYSINSRYLRKISTPILKTTKADEVRKHYTKKRISYIEEILFNYLEEKIKPNFVLFLYERGKETHIEDLGLLTSQKELIE